MDTKEKALTLLENFKELLKWWASGRGTITTRSEINKNLQAVRKLLQETGTSKTVTISPPPMIGGPIVRDVDVLACIFEPPYGVSVISVIVDSIDEAIGVIESNPAFFAKKEILTSAKAKNGEGQSNKIFIVHGKDNELKETVARFIEQIDFSPIILHEQSNKGKTIIEKFEDCSDVGFAVVLMTPDDIGYNTQTPDEKKSRARQNVVFELGYFIGKLGRTRVAAIVKGDIEIPTDISGIVYIGVDGGGAWKFALAKEIKAAGYNIDLNKVI